MLSKTDAVKLGVPPAIRDRYVVRITDARFGPNSKGNPMLTLTAEIAGLPLSDGTIGTEIVRDGITYQVGGLRLPFQYFTLVKGPALGRFFEFQAACGLSCDEVDETNLDVAPYIGKMVEALVDSRTDVERKVLTAEDRAAGKNQGDPIIGSDGKPIEKVELRVVNWLGEFKGSF